MDAWGELDELGELGELDELNGLGELGLVGLGAHCQKFETMADLATV